MLDRDLEILLERIADRDEDALADLYDKTNRLLFSLLLRMLGDTAAAEETLKNVYVEIWERSSPNQLQNSSALSWLISMTRSLAVKEVRFRENSHNSGNLPESICTEVVQSQNIEGDFILERQKLVSSVLNGMPPEHRQILELAYFSCLNKKEIAERLNQPVEKVQMLLQSGMNDLREGLRLSR